MLKMNNFVVELYMLRNPNLSADFISRFIITALSKNFYFKDIIIPIRKSLDRQLKVKRFVSVRRFGNPYRLKVYNFFLKHKKNRIKYFRLCLYFIFLNFKHLV